MCESESDFTPQNVKLRRIGRENLVGVVDKFVGGSFYQD